jgi:hypothetical protein
MYIANNTHGMISKKDNQNRKKIICYVLLFEKGYVTLHQLR